jgi:hypothetical protein
MTLLVTVNKNLASWITGEVAELCSIISKVIISKVIISKVIISKVIISKVIISKVIISIVIRSKVIISIVIVSTIGHSTSEPYRKGRLCTVKLLVQTYLYQLLLQWSTLVSLPFQLVFLDSTVGIISSVRIQPPLVTRENDKKELAKQKVLHLD